MSRKFKRLLFLTIAILLIIGSKVYGQNLEDTTNNQLKREDLISKNIPMDIKYQVHLYNLTKDRNLDYVKTLAIIKHESSFNPNAIGGGNNYGYMQINRVNHANLSKILKTANAPLNPYINLNWGTYMLEKLYRKFEAQGLTGDKLDRAVWSAYNKGEGGYKRTGEATKYIQKTKADIKWIENKLGIE